VDLEADAVAGGMPEAVRPVVVVRGPVGRVAGRFEEVAGGVEELKPGDPGPDGLFAWVSASRAGRSSSAISPACSATGSRTRNVRAMSAQQALSS
jgi:hypothetical protein